MGGQMNYKQLIEELHRANEVLKAQEVATMNVAASLARLKCELDEYQKDYDEYIEEMSLGGTTYQVPR